MYTGKLAFLAWISSENKGKSSYWSKIAIRTGTQANTHRHITHKVMCTPTHACMCMLSLSLSHTHTLLAMCTPGMHTHTFSLSLSHHTHTQFTHNVHTHLCMHAHKCSLSLAHTHLHWGKSSSKFKQKHNTFTAHTKVLNIRRWTKSLVFGGGYNSGLCILEELSTFQRPILFN